MRIPNASLRTSYSRRKGAQTSMWNIRKCPVPSIPVTLPGVSRYSMRVRMKGGKLGHQGNSRKEGSRERREERICCTGWKKSKGGVVEEVKIITE